MAKSKVILDMIEAAVKSKGAEMVKMGGAVFQLIISDGGPDGKLCIDLKNGSGSTKRGEEGQADVTITLADADFADMAEGKLDGMQAFMSGKLKISGNMMLAQKLGPILESAKP
mmetsp:Transcript_1668/g.4126  ORF Transcript_1668/g.4126 Transcript_1668/m.4126 type:complete len:114 (-) Transcript_1668:158-499(-)|eukprot:CAMPEP_0115292148 /NCGR_PEP_ID=MMETSP0270-20121206/64976_1 /TAXON_ID=71861 /ORGANISM="Scrippsiella trochoidea, Strain CCMP3099" /LENGTH=113 /DNA_ID=CAMNT_0002709551 /DNA_START=82 /DNA_END=423 /DNA_ORIENTATION=-